MSSPLKHDVVKWAKETLGLETRGVVQRNDDYNGWIIVNPKTGSYWPYEVVKEIADLAACAFAEAYAERVLATQLESPLLLHGDSMSEGQKGSE